MNTRSGVRYSEKPLAAKHIGGSLIRINGIRSSDQEKILHIEIVGRGIRHWTSSVDLTKETEELNRAYVSDVFGWWHFIRIGRTMHLINKTIQQYLNNKTAAKK